MSKLDTRSAGRKHKNPVKVNRRPSYTGLEYDQGIDYGVPHGAPTAPEFRSLIDEETGGLRSDAHLMGTRQINPWDISGYGQYEDFATGTGPSAYAQASMDQLGLRTQMAMDDAAKSAAGQAARSRSLLGSRGGLSGGALERISQRQEDAALLGGQGARRAQIMGEAGILSQDAQARQGALQNFVGFGADLAQHNVGLANQAEQFNIQNALGQIARERDMARDLYKERGTIWAAHKKSQGGKMTTTELQQELERRKRNTRAAQAEREDEKRGEQGENYRR